MELRRIELDKLDRSLGRLRQVPQAAVQSKMASLRSKGQLSPLVAAEQDGVLVLIDGFVRHQAATRLGLESLLVEVIQVSPLQMKAQLYLRNQERGLQLFEECRLVQELFDVDGLNQVEIGDLLERHKSWVCRRLALYRDLSPHLIEDLSLGLLGPGSLRRLALLPARNQEKLVAVARRDELSPRDTSTLVELWRHTRDPQAHQYLLDSPREAISRARGEKTETTDPRLGRTGQKLLSALEMLTQIALRLARMLHEDKVDLAPPGARLVAEAHRKAYEQCMAAFDGVGSWLDGSGPDAGDET